ncbi:MAG: hypothetical protein ACYDH4_10105 [Candidatus Cryosericum sp.]
MTETTKNGDKNKKTAAAPPAAPDTTTAAASPAAAPPAAAVRAAMRDDDDMVEFNTGFVRTDGFWQNPELGETLDGILLAERRTSGGTALKQPYFIFELCQPFKRMVQRVDPTKPGTKDNQRVVVGQVGQNIGVKANYQLQALMRQQGHRFKLVFTGKENTKSGNTVLTFKITFSRKKYKEIETINENVANAANDEPVAPDEIPF